MLYCETCGTQLTGKRTKNCSKKCERKAWKLRHPDKVREHKKTYYAKHHKSQVDERTLLEKQIERELGLTGSSLKYITRHLKKNPKCLRCGTKDKLHIHHVKPRYVEVDHSITNLTLLCAKCHMLWHKMFPDHYWIGGKKKKMPHGRNRDVVMFSTDSSGMPLAYPPH